MPQTTFLKLGGSLITDKTRPETPRPGVLARLAGEIAAARAQQPALRLVLGHGSGSFGHVAAARHGTRQGVQSAEAWLGFAEVSAAASRLNHLVRATLLDQGVPAVTLQPSASAACEDGLIRFLAAGPVQAALAVGLVPLVHGDVAFDQVRGGTIISTEEVMGYLAGELQPTWLLLAGETAGVLDGQGQVIPLISRENLPAVEPALGGSRGTDVTGGMLSKVLGMLDLVDRHPRLSIRIFSGLEPENVTRLLVAPAAGPGTVIRTAYEYTG